MSESARGEGGRVWVPRERNDKRVAKSIPEADRYYFLEERYPKYGNLVPRDIATREIFKIVYEDHMGIDGQPMVYLDLTHLPKERLHKARRHPRNLREVRRRRPPRSPHEDLPRHALHHGRPLGRLRPADQHPRRLRRRRSRLQHPRSQPPRRQLPPLLHLRRPARPAPTPVAYAKSLPAQTGDGGHAAELKPARPPRTTSSSPPPAPRIPSSSGASSARP